MNLFKKLLCAALVALILITVAVMLIQVSNRGAVELTLQDKTRSFMTDVAGFDLTKYKVNVTQKQPYTFSGVVRETVCYILESNESRLEASCGFMNGTLAHFDIYASDGSPFYLQPLPNGSLDAVKGFLQRYQVYSNASIVQEALNILGTITELEAMNTTVGNLKMRVTGDSIDWVRTISGLEFPTGLSISLNNSVVDTFSDESSFYHIGSADVDIAREEAVRIALEEAKNYTTVTLWGIGTLPFKVAEEPLTVELYVATANFTMYPCWRVRFVADPEVYSVSGVEVGVRADTGEIVYSQTTTYSWEAFVNRNSP